jgi:hypothetical protein
MAAAIGGGLYEHIVLVPLWSASAPSFFSVIQPGTGVPLQNFWIPVHSAITIFLILSFVFTWREKKVRHQLFIGAISYIVMSAWSGLFFIREMLAFQQVPLNSAPTPELSARVQKLDLLELVQRELLDIITFLCFLLALYWLKRPQDV